MKRLVLCADGTWNFRDQVDARTGKRRPTNVAKVARAVLPRTTDGSSVDQVVFYLEGVGTSGGLDRFTGGAFGHGVEDNVRALYRFLVYNYEPGDDLFFFGFSRGAFTVRTLAGFMKWVGLVEKDDDFYVPEIYACYASGKRPGSREWASAFHNVRGVRPCPPIRFLGVWDTVGALGAPGVLGQLLHRNKYAYHDVELHPEIEHAYQALAIDERRKPFAPSVWARPTGWSGTLEQAWFPGVHTNVGGGYDPDGLANEALHWIVEKAEACGLAFDNRYLAFFRPCFNSVAFDSMSMKYRLLGQRVRPLGLGANESVHQAALDRRAHAPSAYSPPNLDEFLRGPGAAVRCNTARVPRGTPC